MPRKPREGRFGAGGEVIADRPVLAVKIAVVASMWTSIEGHIASSLGAIIGSDARVALAILSKLQTATAKSQMIRAVGKAVLDERIYARLENLMKSFDRLAAQRNKVVHGLWGISDVEPDGLIWLPPGAPNRISLGLHAAMKAGDGMALIQDVLADAELWDAADFDTLISDMKQLASESVRFSTQMQGLSIARSEGLNTDAIVAKICEK